MCWIYVLKSSINGKYYIGSTNNLDRRIKQHVAGRTRTTKVLNAFELIYKEEYKTVNEARIREKKLKSYKSHKYVDWLINNKGQ